MAQERCPGQLFDARLGRRWGCLTDWCALIGLVGLTMVVLPLAVASLPDPLRVAGVYDGNDYDDLIITGTPASGPHVAWFGEGPPTVPTRLDMIGRVTLGDTDVVMARVAPTVLARAPPNRWALSRFVMAQPRAPTQPRPSGRELLPLGEIRQVSSPSETLVDTIPGRHRLPSGRGQAYPAAPALLTGFGAP